MLKIWWEHELENIVNSDLGFDVREWWWFLWDWEQEYIPLFICSFCIVRSPKGVSNHIFTVSASKSHLRNINFFLLGFWIWIRFFNTW